MAFRHVPRSVFYRSFSSVSSPLLRTDVGRKSVVNKIAIPRNNYDVSNGFSSYDVSERIPPKLLALDFFHVETKTRTIVEKYANEVLQVVEKGDNILLNAATPYPLAFRELQQKTLEVPRENTSVVYARPKADHRPERRQSRVQPEPENGQDNTSRSWAEANIWVPIRAFLSIFPPRERKATIEETHKISKETMEGTHSISKETTDGTQSISKIGSTRNFANRNRKEKETWAEELLILCVPEHSLTDEEDKQVRNIVRNVVKAIVAEESGPYPSRYLFKTIQCEKDGGRGAGAYGYDKIIAQNLLEIALQLQHGFKPEMEPFSCDLQRYEEWEAIVKEASDHLISTLQPHFDGNAPEISAVYTVMTRTGTPGTCKCQAEIKPIQHCLTEAIVGQGRSDAVFSCTTCDGTAHNRIVQEVNDVKENPRALLMLNTNEVDFDSAAGSDELAADLYKQGYKEVTHIFGGEIRLFCYPTGGAILLHAPFGLAGSTTQEQYAERHITARVLQSIAKKLKGEALPRNFKNPLLGIFFAQQSRNGFHQHSTRVSYAFREAVTPEHVYAFLESNLKPAKGEIGSYPLFQGIRKGSKDHKMGRVINALSFAVDESSTNTAKEKIMSILDSNSVLEMQKHDIMKTIMNVLRKGKSRQCKDLLQVIESFEV